MNESFHVRLETLKGESRATDAPVSAPVTSGDGPTFYIETFGCQMNEHDSEKVAGVLMGRGYTQVDSPAQARVVFYNTCSIREKAAHKLFSRLGLFNPKNGLLESTEGKIIGVLGCVAQQEGEALFDRAPWISLVCGSASYRELPKLLERLESGETRVTGLSKDTDETFETELTRRDHPFRAYLTIIEGCDKACAYCVVPFTRGPERSRVSDSILAETRQLADAGYSEVQLLGQTVNSYRDPSPRRMTFAELLVEVAQVPGIRRVRFMTSHPRDLSPDIVAAMDAVPALCEHLHLPAQSGSTRILRAMQRTYTREEYLEKIAMVRAARRRISLTSDIIVGFPGETESDFEETLTLLDAVKLDAIFAFQYSPRPNTPSLAFPDAVPEQEKARRLQVLLDRQRALQVAGNESFIGHTFEVLVEGAAKRESQWYGRASSNHLLNFTSPASNLLGQYVSVQVTENVANSLANVHVDGWSTGPLTFPSGVPPMEVEMKIRGLMMDPVTNMPIVVLKDANGSAVLPIWVGVYEANAIALEIEKVQTPRPMTHDLLKNVLLGLNVQVQKVVVNELREDTFYALIWVEHEGERMSIDSRPSDALALALRVDCPIFVDDTVLQNSKSSSAITEKSTSEELRKWLEGLSDEDLGRYKM